MKQPVMLPLEPAICKTQRDFQEFLPREDLPVSEFAKAGLPRSGVGGKRTHHAQICGISGGSGSSSVFAAVSSSIANERR